MASRGLSVHSKRPHLSGCVSRVMRSVKTNRSLQRMLSFCTSSHMDITFSSRMIPCHNTWHWFVVFRDHNVVLYLTSKTAYERETFIQLCKMEICEVLKYHSETPPGENQNLFATLTVRTYVWIVPNWALQQSTAKSTDRQVQEIAYQVKLWVSPTYETARTRRSVLMAILWCKVQFGTIYT